MKKVSLYCIACTFLAAFLLVLCLATLEVGLRIKDRWASAAPPSRVPAALTETENFDAPIYVPSPFTLVYNKPDMRLTNLSTNSLGFRGKKELPAVKAPGVKRIFLIGGSAAVGMNASSDEATIAGRLEPYLKSRYKSYEIEVYNAAAAGFNSIQDLIYLAKNIVHYEPDLVIQVGGGTDINTSMEENWRPNYHGLEDSYMSQITHPWHQHSYAITALKNLFPKTNPTNTGRFNPGVAEVYAKNIVQMANIAAGFKIPFVAMLQPALVVSSKQRTKKEESNLERALQRGGLPKNYESLAKKLYPVVQDAMRRVSLPRGSYFIDGTDLFAGHEFHAFSDAFHLTDEGYNFAAEKLGAFVVQKKLL